MEVMTPAHMDFDFVSARSSPHVSPPSTPKRFGDYYISAPTSPSHLSQLYRDFDGLLETSDAGAVSFASPKSPKKEYGFAFAAGNESETASVSAEDLFDGGVIKALELPPPGSRISEEATEKWAVTSPRSPHYEGERIIQGAFSPRNKKGVDPFAVAAENTRRMTPSRERGREGGSRYLASASRRAARSLSPLRDSDYLSEEENQEPQNTKNSSSSICSALPSFSSSKSHRKWRLKDFFLFRSASEGRASDKDPLKKYKAVYGVKNSSFMAIDSLDSGSGSSRRGPPPSPHELHYTVNRAVSEDLKKKTFLPYKQGILGRLAFNPAVHALANGFGFSRK